MNRFKIAMGVMLLCIIPFQAQSGESQREYETRFQIMLQYAVQINEYVRRHVQDKRLCSYAQEMTATNARAAEQMTPPDEYAEIHPHFLLVLENVERSLYYAAEGNVKRYRSLQRIVSKELTILEALADRAGLKPYYETY